MKIEPLITERCSGTSVRNWHAGAAPSTAADTPAQDKLRIIVFGRIPTTVKLVPAAWRRFGAREATTVKMVSVTNGDAGHWTLSATPWPNVAPPKFWKAMQFSAQRAKSGTSTTVDWSRRWPNRSRMIRAIREWKPDVVIGHRPNDYHPDHRYTGVLMQDSAFRSRRR